MRNSGTTIWSPGLTRPYQLGSQNPANNYTWQVVRVLKLEHGVGEMLFLARKKTSQSQRQNQHRRQRRSRRYQSSRSALNKF
jgi:hypothetical protein